MLEKLIGPLFVAIAAMLWATDAVFRVPTVKAIDPTVIVYVEHLFGTFFLLPWMFFKHRDTFYKLRIRDWLAALLVGVGGSALATVFFTASFQYLNPSVAILIQKLQPVIVVVLAFFFLGEVPERKFYPWAGVSILAALVLSFPDFDFSFLRKGLDLHSRGLLYTFLAAFIWAVSTVCGKALLKSLPSSVATFWRYVFGMVALWTLLRLASIQMPWHQMRSPAILMSLIYVSSFSGVFAMIFYYAGLRKTRANVTTFVELLYPVGGVLINTFVLNTPLETLQIAAGTVLILAVTMMSV